jgi:hypothetical protein
MCGIMMAIVRPGADRGLLRQARRDADRALAAMDSRGGDSWGLAVGDSRCRVELRGIGRYQDGGTMPLLAPGSVVVAHTRFATQGEVHLANAHPFSHLGLYAAHNGAYRAPLDYDAWADCDSYALTGEIVRAVDGGKPATLENSGYGTVIASDGEAAYVWRASGQCHAVTRPWGILVTSTPVPDMVGTVITIPDTQTVYRVTHRGAVSPVVTVSLAPEPVRRYARVVNKSSLSTSYDVCMGCRKVTADGWVCRECEAEWRRA